MGSRACFKKQAKFAVLGQLKNELAKYGMAS